MLSELFQRGIWQRRWQADFSQDQEEYDSLREDAEKLLYGLGEYDSDSYTCRLNDAKFEVEMLGHKGKPTFQPRAIKELGLAICYQLLKALDQEQTLVNATKAATPEAIASYEHQHDKARSDLCIWIERLQSWLMDLRLVSPADFLCCCYEYGLDTSGLNLSTGLLTEALSINSNLQPESNTEQNNLNQWVVTDSQQEAPRGIQHSLTRDEVEALYGALVQAGKIEPMTPAQFQEAFTHGSGEVKWKGKVSELSAMLLLLKRKRKVVSLGFWPMAEGVFTISGLPPKRLSRAHEKAGSATLSHIESLIGFL